MTSKIGKKEKKKKKKMVSSLLICLVFNFTNGFT